MEDVSFTPSGSNKSYVSDLFRILSIFEVEFNSEDVTATPVVVKQKEIKLPTYPGLSIRRVRASIKGPYLACFISAKDFGTAISIVNWKEDTGALAVLDSSDISELFANERSSTSTPVSDLYIYHVLSNVRTLTASGFN